MTFEKLLTEDLPRTATFPPAKTTSVKLEVIALSRSTSRAAERSDGVPEPIRAPWIRACPVASVELMVKSMSVPVKPDCEYETERSRIVNPNVDLAEMKLVPVPV